MSRISPNTPETELLLCCARTHITPEIAQCIHSLVQQNIDWEYLLQTSLKQRVMPLLYQSLKNTCPKEVPDKFFKQLRSYYLTNATRNLFLTGKLLKILSLFKNNNILAVPFKGPVLAESVYGDITLRQFSDLDILVHPEDAIKARNLLMANGYRPEIELDDKQFGIYLKTEDTFTLISGESRVVVELHWELTGRNSSFPIYLDLFDNRLERTEIEGKKVYNLPPEELLLYLCIHGAKHCWDSIDWICCLAELIQSNSVLNWERAIKMAREVYCMRIFFLGLFLAHDLIGVNLSEKILNYLETDQKIKILAEEVYKNLFQKENETIKSKISNRFSFFHITVKDHLSDKIRYIAQIAVCPTKEDWRKFPLPASISLLHYFLRPARLVVGLAAISISTLKVPVNLQRKFQKIKLSWTKI
jgi:hypothetical protein